jgi:CubicO group peptidase (beta-lactamase class C family)
MIKDGFLHLLKRNSVYISASINNGNILRNIKLTFNRLKLINYLALLSVFILPLSLCSQPVETRPQVSFEEIDAFIEKAMADWKVPGVSFGIIKNGVLIYSKGYGYADLETKEPVTDSTIFAIGSITKSFTAASVLSLQDDSLIRIDKPVIDFLPGFRLYDSELTEMVTVKDLLTHRTGVPRHDLVWYGSDLSRKQLYSKIKYLRPSTGMREKFQYQNMMYLASGYLIEKITGKTWEEYVSEKFIRPLGMRRTSLSVKDLDKYENYAKPYVWLKDTVMKISFRNVDAIGPAGSINSSVTDLARWVSMNMNMGMYEGRQYLSKESINEMQMPQVVVPSYATNDVFYMSYGMGWFITSYRGHLRVEHGGNIDGFTSSIAFYPHDSLGIIVLSNLNGSGITGAIRNTVFDMLNGLPDHNWNGILLEGYLKRLAKDWEESKPDTGRFVMASLPKSLISFAGTYKHKAYGTMEIDEVNDTLYAVIHGIKYRLNYDTAMVFTGYNDYFGAADFNFTVSSSTGRINGVKVPFEPEVDDIEFKKVKGRTPKEPKSANTQMVAAVNKYSGEYSNTTQVIKVVSKDKSLLLSIPGKPVYELVKIGNGLYNLKNLTGYAVKFSSDEKGNITGIILVQPDGEYTAARIK